MELPPTVLSEPDRSMRPPTRTGTHSVTGDAFDTRFAPAVATLNPPNSEADFATSFAAARPSTLRRQSLQSVIRRLYEAAGPAATDTDNNSEASKITDSGASRTADSGAYSVKASGTSVAEDIGSMLPTNSNAAPTAKHTRKRRRQTCCPDTIFKTPGTIRHIHDAVATTITTAVLQNEAPDIHSSLEASLQFDVVLTRLTASVNHLADIATTRASKLCVMRENSQQDANPIVGRALNAEVEAELGVVSELSNVASDLVRMRHLWMTATELPSAPYEAIARTVDQLIREAEGAPMSETYGTSRNNAFPSSYNAKLNSKASVDRMPARHRRKEAPHKQATDEPHARTTAQTDEQHGDASTKLDRH